MIEEDLRLFDREQTDPYYFPNAERDRLLADDRRRVVLAVLEDEQMPLSLREVTERVCERESAASTDATGGPTCHATDGSAVEITLHHVHLPMLDEAGCLTYDPETKTVVPVGDRTN